MQHGIERKHSLETKEVPLLLWKANSLNVMEGLLHNRSFSRIPSFPNRSSDFYYYRIEILQKIGQKITMVGEKKKLFFLQ